MATTDERPWGRVDDTGTVFVRVADGERVVGEYPDATKEEALAYYERKYADLAGQVTLLEQRAKRGAPAADVAKAVASLSATVSTANAVGDLQALADRLAALGGTVQQLTEQQTLEAKEALAHAIEERTAIVTEIEALAAEDPEKIQWKQASAKLDDLFGRWQRHQHSGPRLPKGEANELWKRFRAARATIERGRKQFFADLDAQHKDARERKTRLIERAEALIPRGAAAIGDYRGLLEEWKRSGRSGKRTDDALWARFKAAGDAVYQAKAEIDAKENEEYEANLAQKLALLDEAEPLKDEKDRERARAALRSIQERWDAIGKVPRERLAGVEERLRKVENAVRRLDEEHWERNDPEKKARQEGLAAQLRDSIGELEAELAAAQAGGNAAAITAATEALEARRAWLDALG